MTRPLSLAVFVAVLFAFLASCTISSSKTEGPIEACAPVKDILGVQAVCERNSDCCSYNCRDGRCWESTALGGFCRTSVDCGPNLTCKAGVCAGGVLCHDNGDVCTGPNGVNTQCCHGHCSGFVAGISYGECTYDTPPVVVINNVPLDNASRNVPVTIYGSVSDPDGGSPACTWSATPPGRSAPTVSQPGNCSGPTSFQLTPGLEGPWTIALSGDDGFNADPANPRPVVKKATLNVVNDAPIAATVPIPGNEPSTVYANLDADVGGHATITALDGSASSDRNGDTWTYLWTVLSAPETIVLVGADTVTPTFTASAVGDYVLSLVVTDDRWDLNDDPDYRGADRPGTPSTPLTVTVHVARHVTPLADQHDLLDADYARTANKIVLLGHQPTDPNHSNGMLWVYDVATGTEGTGIGVQEPPNLGWSNQPTSVGVTSDWSTTGGVAVVGDPLHAWKITPLNASAVVTKLTPTTTTGCPNCPRVLPIGDVVVVGTRHAFLFNPSGIEHFVDLDLNNSNNPFTEGGGYGRSGAGYANDALLVANTTQSYLDRYTVNPSGSSFDFANRYYPYSCSNARLWAGQSGEYVFDSCGHVYSNGTTLAPVGSPTPLTLTPAPAHLDSRASGYATIGQNGTQVNRYTSTLGPAQADVLPVWADSSGGKHPAFGKFAFLAPDANHTRIVFVYTNETVPRWGVLRFDTP